MKSKVIIVLLSLGALACEDKNCEPNTNCVRVKLVKELCGQAILQILDESYFSWGQSWEDGDGVQYENVFTTLLPCELSDNFGDGSGTIEPGDEFTIRFTGNQHDDECARCKALLDGPEKFLPIEVTDNCVDTEE